jgi:hypothetical protein
LFPNEDSVVSTEVFSHKFVLSLASDVFKREFYGSMKESGEGIEAKDGRGHYFISRTTFCGYSTFFGSSVGGDDLECSYSYCIYSCKK